MSDRVPDSMSSRLRVAAALIALPTLVMLVAMAVVERGRARQDERPADAVEAGTGTIAGLVFVDRNENGEVDPGDEGLAGQKILLTNAIGTRQVQETASGPDGTFHLAGLVKGSYRLTIIVPQGFQRTTDNSFALEITGPDQTQDVRFGLSPTSRR